MLLLMLEHSGPKISSSGSQKKHIWIQVLNRKSKKQSILLDNPIIFLYVILFCVVFGFFQNVKSCSAAVVIEGRSILNDSKVGRDLQSKIIRLPEKPCPLIFYFSVQFFSLLQNLVKSLNYFFLFWQNLANLQHHLCPFPPENNLHNFRNATIIFSRIRFSDYL